jgi:ATP-dependent Clp protease ATP-binding subunit ClpA
MQLAQNEARRLNHEYVGTEHILLGLAGEATGVATNVLKNLDIDLHKIRMEVEKIVCPGPDTLGTGRLPNTPRAKKIIEFALDEAKNLDHSYVGTEHLLLGTLREQEGIACQVLTALGVKLEEVREEVLRLIGTGKQKTADDPIGRDFQGAAAQWRRWLVLGHEVQSIITEDITAERERIAKHLEAMVGARKAAGWQMVNIADVEEAIKLIRTGGIYEAK